MSEALELLSPVWKHKSTIQPVRGSGCHLYDAAGQEYLDFTCGIGVTNTGHAHPRVVQAIQQQAERLLFGQINIVIPPITLQLAEQLNKITPTEINRFFFTNSGAEAIESAVKLSRHATGRRNLIVFQGSFHGRTAQTMAMTTSKTIYRHRYQPLPSAVFVTPFPAAKELGMEEPAAAEFALGQLWALLASQSAPDETAAIIIEPVLGEGGYVPAPRSFLQGLRKICDETGILLVVDEVQSGFGRTGRFFAFEHADITPDLIVMAKGLGSGMPISALGARQELMERWEPGTHGGTYGGGSAVAIAAACATIETIQEEGLLQNAARIGDQLQRGLHHLRESYPAISDVRGLGAMVGCEFSDAQGQPDTATASAVADACLQHNLLLLTCGTHDNVIRWIPPLVATREETNQALEVFATALAEVIGA
ncbi:MAG: aminotransferase class III-fold pyridoxal phosphate-dependent enzyme [Chloroflexi bacterium]|nr:aminotransferase class III-fold pyridoxal phosphate-dependent enzyme [Chloroflexota bacterium]